MPTKKRIMTPGTYRAPKRKKFPLVEVTRKKKKPFVLGATLDSFLGTSRSETEVQLELYKEQQKNERADKRAYKKLRDQQHPPATLESFFVKENANKKKAA